MSEYEPSAAPPPPPPPGGGSENRTVMIVLSYLWLLALIPFLIEKEDREVQWHARHGLVLTAAEFVLWIGVGVLSMVPVLGCFTAILGLILFIPIVVLHIMCIVKGVNGERLTVPGLSEFASRF